LTPKLSLLFLQGKTGIKKYIYKPGIVAHNHGSRPDLAKVSEILSQKTSQLWWYTSVIPATWEVEVGGSWSKASPGKKHETLSGK
jgi:hypothetical protein